MNHDLNARRKTRPKRAVDYGMTRYEWAIAKQQMDDAMLLGRMTLRLVARMRTALRDLGRSLNGLPASRRTEGVRGR